MPLRLLFNERDELGLVLACVPSTDLLPLALVCTTLFTLCAARADRERGDGPRWITAATTTLARMIWAVDVMDATIPSSWCAALAKRGDEALLRFLLSGIRWEPPDLMDASVCAAAAAGGHVGLLQWLQQHQCQRAALDVSVCKAAAEAGHLAVLRWLRPYVLLRKRGCLTIVAGNAAGVSKIIMVTAIQHGHLEIVQWLHGHMDGKGPPCLHYADFCLAAAEYGQLDVLKWLGSQGRASGPAFITAAARNGHVATLQWMRSEYGDRYDELVFNVALQHGQLAPLQWLRALGLRPSGDEGWCCLAAARAGHLDVLKWLRSQGHPWAKGVCLKIAEMQGHTAVAEWIRVQP